MIFIKNAQLDYGSKKLFDNISTSFFDGQRVGLVGRNGSGKTTLLKALAKKIDLDEGKIVIDQKKKVSYMPQEIVLLSDKSIYDEVFSVFDEFINLENKKVEIEKKLEQKLSSDPEKLLQEYTRIIEKLDTFNKQEVIAKTEEILLGLGFDRKIWDNPISSLSVGWKMRVVLAKLLLEDADFYLFDEPTNHLDIVSKNWFFNFLKKSKFGFLLVSHDRFFLDNSCDYTFELRKGKGKLFNGNYSRYLEQKEHGNKLLESQFITQQKEISRQKRTIDRFRYTPSKSKMVQSMIKKLEKVELVEIESKDKNVSFNFDKTVRSGRIVLEFKNLSKSFGNKVIFKNISGRIEKGQKVALIAPNGAGKTTLLNLIIGKYSEHKNNIDFGYNVDYAIFEQDQVRLLNPNNTIYDEILEHCPNQTEQTVRDFLGKFLFSKDDINKTISVLSGGERNRVGMIKVLLKNANFLILDEPTNHLDIYTKEILLKALKDYQGTILFVSHDIDFISKLANRILELTPEKLYSYEGNYESYIQQKLDIQPNSSQPKIDAEKSKDKEIKKSNNYKKIKKLESEIAKLEKKISKLNLLFAEYIYGTNEYNDLVKKISTFQKELDSKITQWENFDS